MNIPYMSLRGGEFGAQVISDTATHTPADTTFKRYSRITALSATVFAAGTVGNVSNISGAALPAGATIEGQWNVLQLTSGSIIAYYKSPSA